MKKKKNAFTDPLNIWHLDTKFFGLVTDSKTNEIIKSVINLQDCRDGKIFTAQNLVYGTTSFKPSGHPREHERWYVEHVPSNVKNGFRSSVLRFLNTKLHCGLISKNAMNEINLWVSLSAKEKRKTFSGVKSVGRLPNLPPTINFEHVYTTNQTLVDKIIYDVYNGRIGVDKNGKFFGKKRMLEYAEHAVGIYTTKDENQKIIKKNLNRIIKEEQSKSDGNQNHIWVDAVYERQYNLDHYDGVELSDRSFVPPGTKPHPQFITEPMRKKTKEQKKYPVIGMEKYLKEDKKI
tara:strand:+ start:50 stop:922 length:873 start_codon:yes stop_codon:yes gene_type:complete